MKKRDGKPAAGVLVRYEADGLETRWVETGADGAFRLADLPARRGSVVADAGDERLRRRSSPSTPGPGPSPSRDRPGAADRPRGADARRRDAETRAAREAHGDRGATGVRIARSGADGRFRLKGLRPGDVSVRADEPRFVLWTRAQVPAREGGVEDARHTPDPRRVPLGARRRRGRPPGAGREGPGLLRRRQPIPHRGTGDGGRPGSDDPLARRRDLLGLAPSARREPAASPCSTPTTRRGSSGESPCRPGGRSTGAVVTLRRGLVLAGTVKDPEGNPIAGAELGLSQSRVVRSSRGGMMMQMSFAGVSDVPAARAAPTADSS